MYNNLQLTGFLRTVSLWVGILMFLISGFLSYDGFDGSVGATGAYTTAGKVIGVVFAIAVGVLQFIYATDSKGLNKTLKILGILSYSYSIYTNKLGAENLLLMNESMSWATAIIADIAAEPMIAWGLGEALSGDFIGNFMSDLFGKGKTTSENPYKKPSNNSPRNVNPELRKKIGGFSFNDDESER